MVDRTLEISIKVFKLEDSIFSIWELQSFLSTIFQALAAHACFQRPSAAAEGFTLAKFVNEQLLWLTVYDAKNTFKKNTASKQEALYQLSYTQLRGTSSQSTWNRVYKSHTSDGTKSVEVSEVSLFFLHIDFTWVHPLLVFPEPCKYTLTCHYSKYMQLLL